MLVKRVTGVPGDVVALHNGVLFVHQRKGPEDLSTEAVDPQAATIPPGHYYVMSDNPRGACDSRHVGVIARADVVGEVVLIYSPPLGIRRP